MTVGSSRRELEADPCRPRGDRQFGRSVRRARTAAPAKTTPTPEVTKPVEVAKIPVPMDADELRHLVQVTEARRWCAGNRGDAALVALLEARLAHLGASVGPKGTETVDIEVPKDPAALANLIRVQRARRYRAAKRGTSRWWRC